MGDHKQAVSAGAGGVQGERTGKAMTRRRGFHRGSLRRREQGHGHPRPFRRMHVPAEPAGPRGGRSPSPALLPGGPCSPGTVGDISGHTIYTPPRGPRQEDRAGRGEGPAARGRAPTTGLLMVFSTFIHRRVRSSQRKEIRCLEPCVRVRLVLQVRDSRHTKQPGTNRRLSFTGLGSMVIDMARSLLKSTS